MEVDQVSSHLIDMVDQGDEDRVDEDRVDGDLVSHSQVWMEVEVDDCSHYRLVSQEEVEVVVVIVDVHKMASMVVEVAVDDDS